MLKSEAMNFLKNVLKIDNVEAKSSDLKLLKEICLKVPQVIPFQNLSMLLQDDRHLPTFDEIMTAGRAGIGGICYTFGIFGQQLLQALDYDVFKVACTIKQSERSYTHLACIVEGFAPGERYFVDFGASYPTFQPVPLHALPQYYENAFLKYSFVPLNNGKIARKHVSSTAQFLDLVSSFSSCKDNYETFFEFEETPRDNEFIESYQTPIYTIPDYAADWFLMGLRITLYPDNAAYTLSDFVLKTWRKGEQVNILVLKNEKELEDVIKKYFPMLRELNVSKAITNLTKTKKLFGRTENYN